MMVVFVLREENRGLVSSLVCPAAGRGGGVQGGQSPFISTLDAAGSVCSSVAPSHNKAFCKNAQPAQQGAVQGGLGALPATSRKRRFPEREIRRFCLCVLTQALLAGSLTPR